jgi:putative ABC transport system permease protein
MSFVLKMAWRDTRASRRRLVLFSFTIVLGIAALVAVGSFGSNLRQAVRGQPQTLLGADISIGLGSAPTAEFQHYVDSLGAQQGREKRYGASLSPVGGAAGNRMVQVRAIDGGFPFYGGFITEPADAVARLQTGDPVAIVDPLVLQQFGLHVGDSIKLGEKPYVVVGSLVEFPAEPAILATLVPRVFIPWQAMPPPKDPKASGDQGFHNLFLKLPAGADQAAIARDLRSRFTNLFPRVTTSDELAKNIDQALVAADRFLSLVVFVSLFLGAIGLASTLHVYIRQKLNTVAVLRCLGASARASFSIYLLQTAALGLCGATGGALLGIATQFALPTLLRDFLPVRLEVFVAWQPVLTAMGSGFGLCMAFTLLPLMAVRRVPPLAAVRSNILGGEKADPLQPLLWAIMAAAVVLFAWTQTRSWTWALAYSAALAMAFGIFFGTARAVTWASRRWLPAAAPYAVRQGVANLHRPNNRTTLLLLALGLGMFLILTLYLTRATLDQEYSGANSPNLVLAEIGDTDIAALRKLVPAQGGRLIQEIPSVELKLTTVNGAAPGKTGNARGPGGRLGPGAISNLRASYRRKLPAAEKVIAGAFTGVVAPGTAVIPISIQGWLVGRNGPLKLGDEVVWDVEGVPIRTRVTSVRRMEGLQFEPNFPVLFPEGALEAAPKQYMLLVRAATPAISRRIQQAVLAAAPNTRVQDLAVLVDALDRIFARVAGLIDFIAFFTVATGVIMLAAAAVTGRYQRARETVLLRTLGASRLQLRKIQFTEYAILGVLAALVGSLLATIVNILLAHFLFKLPPAITAGGLLAATAAVVLVTVGTGVLADRGIARTSPLEILRQET